MNVKFISSYEEAVAGRNKRGHRNKQLSTVKFLFLIFPANKSIFRENTKMWMEGNLGVVPEMAISAENTLKDNKL